MTFLANPHFILQISHAKTFKWSIPGAHIIKLSKNIHKVTKTDYMWFDFLWIRLYLLGKSLWTSGRNMCEKSVWAGNPSFWCEWSWSFHKSSKAHSITGFSSSENVRRSTSLNNWATMTSFPPKSEAVSKAWLYGWHLIILYFIFSKGVHM